MTWFSLDPQHFAQDYATFAGLTSAFVAEYEYQTRRENEWLRLENERLRLENERLASERAR